MQPNQPRPQSFTQSVGELYRGELKDILSGLETQRLAIQKKGLTTALGIIGAVFLALFFVPGWLRLLLIPGGVAAWFVLLEEPIKQYRINFKKQLIDRLIKLYDRNLSYNPEGGISQQEFCNSFIYQHSVDRYKAEDLIYGLLDKTAVRFSEVHAEYKKTTTDSDGEQHHEWYTLFKGVFFIADFNKHFKGKTLIQPDHLESAWGSVGSWLQSSLKAKAQIGAHKAQLVKLEDPIFERLFSVYSTDQIEARYILSTSLMQRLVNFHNRVGKPLYTSFTNSKLHIAIPNDKNLFEPPSVWFGSALMSQQEVQAYFDDIKLFAGIVEDLNLNLRIWTKS